MGAASTPATRVENAYRQWRESKGKDGDVFLDLMADHCEMRSVLSPRKVDNDLADHRKSKAEAREYFQVLERDWEMIDFPQHRILADGDTVVWIGECHWRNRKTGRDVGSPKVDIWTFEDGKAVAFFEMFDSLAFAQTAGLI
ncbi:nuclear transport factor 2 family protein [Sphingomonas tabacisoli]|uniref:Nuclear transport factor 2 family protein n=1 Tax=Sphingomonas tabacisoli TaxID=2249466 RepID=A0ABW4HYS0_9SPHN